MEINVPATMHPTIKLIVDTPEGVVYHKVLGLRVASKVRIDLPPSVDPVDVQVHAVELGRNGAPVGEPLLVKPHERRNTEPVFEIAEPAPIKDVFHTLAALDEPDDEDFEDEPEDGLEPSPDLELSDDLELE